MATISRTWLVVIGCSVATTSALLAIAAPRLATREQSHPGIERDGTGKKPSVADTECGEGSGKQLSMADTECGDSTGDRATLSDAE